MKKYVTVFTGLLCGACPSVATQTVTRVVEGTVRKVDTATRTVTVNTARGTADTFHYADRTAIHGAKDGPKTEHTALDGLKDGDRVVVHSTKEGAEETASEIDRVGEDGLKATKGTVSDIDRGAKTVSVKTGEGGKEVFDLSDHASVETGKDTAQGLKKSTKVVVYYTDEGGRKVAHYVKRVF